MAIEELIPYSIAIIVIFAALLSIIYTIWGWFLMIISAGTEEKVKKAVNHIRHAIIWVIFILWVLYVLPVLMKLSGIPYEEYMKPKVVFDTMVKISDNIFWWNIDWDSMDFSDSSSAPGSNFSDL
jgi:hypothetical protein